MENQQTLLGSGMKCVFLLDEVLCCRFGETNTTQMVIPESLKSTILENMHNKFGNLGIAKMMGKVKERFYW